MNTLCSFMFAILSPIPHNIFKSLESFLKGSSWLVLIPYGAMSVVCLVLNVGGVLSLKTTKSTGNTHHS